MEIGKEGKPFIIEPVPEPQEAPEPTPEKTPRPVEPEPIPADS
jgi:hypothetical protein